LQHLECRRVRIGDAIAVDLHRAGVPGVEVVLGVGDDGEGRGVLRQHRPVAPVDGAAVFGELTVEQLEVGWVVTDHAVALIDMVAILGQTRTVEQLEGRGVGVGKRHTVEEDVGPVDPVGRVERREGVGVGIGDFDRIAREGLEVVDLAGPDVVAGALEQGIRWSVFGCTPRGLPKE